jgi:hypothetical protein
VTLKSREGAEYAGQVAFDVDPAAPEETDTGALSLSLATVDGDATSATTGKGDWWTWRCGFFGFTFAYAQTDSSGLMIAMGFECGDHLFGTAGVFNDAVIESGQYHLYGSMAESSETVADERDTDEAETGEQLESLDSPDLDASDLNTNDIKSQVDSLLP